MQRSVYVVSVTGITGPHQRLATSSIQSRFFAKSDLPIAVARRERLGTWRRSPPADGVIVGAPSSDCSRDALRPRSAASSTVWMNCCGLLHRSLID